MCWAITKRCLSLLKIKAKLSFAPCFNGKTACRESTGRLKYFIYKRSSSRQFLTKRSHHQLLFRFILFMALNVEIKCLENQKDFNFFVGPVDFHRSSAIIVRKNFFAITPILKSYCRLQQHNRHQIL